MPIENALPITPALDPHQLFRLDGKVAFISGGTRGIGRAIAETFARQGASVAVLARRQDELDGTAEALDALGAPNLMLRGSQGDVDFTDEAVARCVETLGGADILVCNAAANPYHGPLIDIEHPAIRKTLEVNLEGPLLLAQSCWRRWMRDHGGAIINVASGGGMRPVAGLGIYNISKAGLIHLNQQLAMELGPMVRVNTLTPGLVKTDFARALWERDEERKAAMYPAKRLGFPQDLASAALYLASEASSWVTGQNLVVDGGRSVM